MPRGLVDRTLGDYAGILPLIFCPGGILTFIASKS